MRITTIVIVALLSATSCLAGEKENDARVWALTRQMLIDFGFTNKVAAFDGMYLLATTATPRNDNNNTPALAVVLIAANCGTNDLPAVLRSVEQWETNTATVVAGLMLWTELGGKPLLRGDDHYALHFIYGAAAEVLCNGGDYAAEWKETRDQLRGGIFNTNQMNAAKEGALWVRNRP